MLDRQARFRLAADAVTAAPAGFPEVEKVALIGSVARPRPETFRHEDGRASPCGFRGCLAKC